MQRTHNSPKVGSIPSSPINTKTKMSKIKQTLRAKENFCDCIDDAIQTLESYVKLQSNISWEKDVPTIFAPDKEWIEEKQKELAEINAGLNEILAARQSIELQQQAHPSQKFFLGIIK
jgi:hypothetical protein